MNYFDKKAQHVMIVDPEGSPAEGMSLIPIEVHDEDSFAQRSEEHHKNKHHEHTEHEVQDDSGEIHPTDESLEVEEPPFEIMIEDIPGAPPGTKDPEPVIEVKEEDTDKNNLEPTKDDKWNPNSSEDFFQWAKSRLDSIPTHSGSDIAGCERAAAYLEKFESEVSKHMRSDLDGKIDANKVEKLRAQIEHGLTLLFDRVDKLKKHSRSKRKKKAEISFTNDPMIKEAQKITGVQGVFITVPLLISRIARVCINGMVSAGHDIEDIFDDQVKKYKLNDREQAETMQLLEDMGYAFRQDRGHMRNDQVDTSSENNYDWSAQYNA